MKVETWVRVSELFCEALELPAPERPAFLERSATDIEVRGEVERLLALHERDGNSLAGPTTFLRPAAPATGTRIGNYTLQRVLGSGGMGTVYEALQDRPKRTVALKTLRIGFSSPARLQRFLFEAEVLGNLRHPAIAQIYEAGTHEEDGQLFPYFAMELVAGARDLLSYAREEELALPARLALFLDVCDAVHHGHLKGVIHRDLKAGNILVDAEGRAKVIDFGVARATDRGEHGWSGEHTQAGQIVGTLATMSPEQVSGDPDQVDLRSDVYSLGVVLYELLAGKPPYELAGLPLVEALAQVREARPPPSADLPSELYWIALRALEKDPARRYASASELAADLRRYLAHEPVLARPPGKLYLARKFVQRHTLGVAATAAIAAVLVAGIVGTSWQAARADREATQATRMAGDVLRLSALQELDDLVAEADVLWPAFPENVTRYETWLAKAARLVGELPDHRAKLAELRSRARPWNADERAAAVGSHPAYRQLETARRHLEFLTEQRAAFESVAPQADPAAEHVGVDLASLPQDAMELNQIAWRLVDPQRNDWGGEARGLVLARRALELATRPIDRAAIRDTLAWALFASGRLDEAMAESEQALAEAGEKNRAVFEGYLERLRASVDGHISPEGAEESTRQRAELEREIGRLEAQLGSRPEWTFDDSQDKWWHNQLEKLVHGLEAFSDAETGISSAGTSPGHGWGVDRRREFALALRDGYAAGGEYEQRWAEALPEIRARYPGLDLVPQLGLLPIGPDPDSRLWEFAELATGTPAQRGSDDSLVITEETGLVLVLLPGGTLQIGAQRTDPNGASYDPGADVNEGPVHEVTLSPFFLSKYEMTQGQWLRITGQNPSFYNPLHSWGWKPTLLHPVEQVSWTTAVETIARLGLTLPSEAQWEYAARGGTSSIWWTGDERDSLAGAVNLADQAAARVGATWTDIDDWPELDDGYHAHSPVHLFRPNPFGLHNVHGNVWEWCLDGYKPSYQGAARIDPVVALPDVPLCVTRGGGFGSAAFDARSANRDFYAADDSDNVLGLRPARNLAP